MMKLFEVETQDMWYYIQATSEYDVKDIILYEDNDARIIKTIAIGVGYIFRSNPILCCVRKG